MKRDECLRLWEAQAVEDGRLVGVERLSFERHVASCGSCGKEIAALAALHEAMTHAPAPESSVFQHNRLRAELLRRANDRLVGASSRVGTWRSYLAIMALVVLGFGTWSVQSRRTNTNVAPVMSTPKFDVSGDPQARWAVLSGGSAARVTLERGTVSVHVERLQTGQRFLLTLPDGELEVHGTTFTVELTDGRTRRVEVSEGVVSLRLRGDPERWLNAGEGWHRSNGDSDETEANARKQGNAGPIADDELGRSGDRRSALPGLHTTRPPTGHRAAPSNAIRRLPSTAGESTAVASRARAPLVETPQTPVQEPLAAHEQFSEAVDAFRAGLYDNADGKLARFARDFPDDPRCEDALFLRAVGRSRLGDAAGAAALARAYLARFPRGLRRTDAERLMDDGPLR